MESIVLEVTKSFGSYGLILASILFIIKLSPITLMTSHKFERQLYSKETRFIYKTANYLAIIGIFSILIYFITLLVWNLKVRYFNVLFQVIFVLMFTFQLALYWIKHSKINFEKLNRVFWMKFKEIRDVLIYPYIVLWPLIWGYYFGIKLVSIADANGKIDISKYIATFFLIVIFTIFLLEFLLPPIKYLLNLGQKDIEHFIVLEGVRWYLFHPINKDEFLIGDNACLDECEKIRVIKREELVNKDICLNS